jgi:general secretion pathway protein E
MNTLRDDGARKVLAGLTSVEEVLAATQEDVDVEGLAAGAARAAPAEAE